MREKWEKKEISFATNQRERIAIEGELYWYFRSPIGLFAHAHSIISHSTRQS